jgi:hypothetical protein
MGSSIRRVSILVLAAVGCAILDVAPVGAAEITLFGFQQTAVAYIADDLTIYRWAGDPVGYLAPDPDGGYYIYAFNGTHLGWYVAGVVRDHHGYSVGARRGAFASGTFAAAVQYEPYKAFKQLMPFKATQEFAPVRPVFVNQWSQASLDQFLMQGHG